MISKRKTKPHWGAATRLVHAGQTRSGFKETSEAIYMTSGYIYESAEEAEAAFNNSKPRFVYSRYANPTVAMFEERMADLEGAETARTTSSGMAAVFAALACQVKSGDHVVSSDALFGSCHYIINDLMTKWGVEVEFVDGRDNAAWARALSRPTKTVFLESPSNPGLRLVDVAAVADLAHKAGATLVVDNVFATPLLQQPLKLGADVVVYSATKHIDGQGRSLGGVILSSRKFVEELLQPFLRHTGPALSPMNAWLLLKGLETLEIRVTRQSASAESIARKLVGHEKLGQVLYPTLEQFPQRELARRQMSAGGTLLGISLKGGKPAVFKFMNAMELILISNNLGDAKSLATHPATSTHQRLTPEQRAAQGIDDGLVRISIGLEDPADILEDITQALESA
jgi:O-succinylhomoserine sulfhydrylase